MQIYLDCYGTNTLLKGAVISCTIFYVDIPLTLSTKLDQISHCGNKIALNSFYKVIQPYTDYFYNNTVLIEHLEGIDRLNKIRSIAYNLIHTSAYSSGQLIKDIEIFTSHNILLHSFDFLNIKSISKYNHSGLIISKFYAREAWGKHMFRLSQLYPKHKFTAHYGVNSPLHLKNILDFKTTPFHNSDTMKAVASFIYREIVTYLNNDYLIYQKYLKKLPKWWLLFEDNKVETLADYFSPTELITFKQNITLCKDYIRVDFYEKLKLPCIKPFSKNFIKFLKENPPD